MTRSQTVLVPKALLTAPDQFGGTSQLDCLMGEAVVRDGRLVGLEKAKDTALPSGIVLPHLVEPHCHLDKCHTITRLGSVGGDLSDALEAQRRDKPNWTEADLAARAGKGLQEARTAQVGVLRTHVDWSQTTEPPLAWQVIKGLSEDTTDITVQFAALTSVTQMADPVFAAKVAKTVQDSGGVLGAFVLDHDNAEDGIRQMFHAADTYGLMLDFHVDEGLGPYNGLETIADIALETAFEGPVLCGHAISLMDKAPNDVSRIADKLARAGIAVCCLPTTNLYLQGRTEGTPDRRGLTRMRELDAAGVSVLVGSDNVADAFCPFGAHDPMASLHLACLAGHLDPPLGKWLPTITSNAGSALGHANLFVDQLPVEDLVLSDQMHTADVIAGRSQLRRLTVTGGALALRASGTHSDRS